jgi:hypothetical protein
MDTDWTVGVRFWEIEIFFFGAKSDRFWVKRPQRESGHIMKRLSMCGLYAHYPILIHDGVLN